MFLVGGFGGSEYLRQELLNSFDVMSKKMKVFLRRPSPDKSYVASVPWHMVARLTVHSLTAVVQGGVIYGVEKGMLNIKLVLPHDI